MDDRYPNFAIEPRNVRLGLATDGFNPYRTMGLSHNTWPIVMVNYNMPPWLIMKPDNLILSTIIPGPAYPGDKIDVYMQPLIAELRELWDVGAKTYDASHEKIFTLRVGLLWTINDFPGYTVLLGWSIKGKLGYPKNDPFVLSSQVQQVFYIQDCTEKHLYYVVKKSPRDHNDAEYGNGVVEEVSGPTMHDIEVHFQMDNQYINANWLKDDLTRMEDNYFYVRFSHKGQFLKTKYHDGICTKIPTAMDPERFSYSVLMEYVKDNVGYTEIGGVYVKKVGGGWKLLDNDKDICELVNSLSQGSVLDLYIDTVVDKAIEPDKQLQPHVIIRSRTSFLKVNYYEEGRKKRIEENEQRVKELGLREYVPGHDSLSEGEEEKKIKKPITGRRPVTRSKAASKVLREEEAVDHGDTLSSPTPPSLPTDIHQFKQLKRVPLNHGVGTMAAYNKLHQSKKNREDAEKERENDLMNNADDAGENRDNTITTKTVSDDNKVRAEFSSFLGKLSRECMPLDYVSWLEIPDEQKNSWWDFVKQKFIIPEEGKDWVMKIVDESWRVYKSRFKSQYYIKYDTDEDQLKNRPHHILLEQFKSLLAYWSDETVKDKARKMHKIGKKLKMHTRLAKKKKNMPKSPSKGQIYHKTRKLIEEENADDNFEEVNDDTKRSAELEKIKEELSAEMEEKMNKKLKNILKNIVEMTGLQISIDDLLADNSDEEGVELAGDEAEAAP
ncbi:hypothetical protein AgCh_024355 [Apium graveolens]